MNNTPVAKTDRHVSIVILNWNGWEDTVECLESVFRMDYPSYEVIIVDNFSSDDSLEKIRNWCQGKISVKSKYIADTAGFRPIELKEYTAEEFMNRNVCDKSPAATPSLTLVKNNENSWFSGGNNLAMKRILEEMKSAYIWLLNNDTVVEPSYVSELLHQDWLCDSSIWAFGGRIMNYQTEDDQIQKFGRMDKPTLVNGISWAGIFLKCSALNAVWLLDENLFLYCEDVDLCLRIREKYDIYYIPTTSKMYHKMESSSRKANRMKIVLHTRNLFIMLRRHKRFLFKNDFAKSFYHLAKNNLRADPVRSAWYLIIGTCLWIVSYIKNPWIKF